MEILLCTWIIFCPDSDEFVQMMSPKDGAVPGEIVKVVHDDSHKQVEHEEAAEEDKGDKEEVGDVAATGLIRVQKFSRCSIPLHRPWITYLSSSTGQHDVWPGLSCGAPATL